MLKIWVFNIVLGVILGLFVHYLVQNLTLTTKRKEIEFGRCYSRHDCCIWGCPARPDYYDI